MSNILGIDKRIEELKREWAKYNHSPFWFWNNYVRSTSNGKLSYKQFLRKINWYGELTYGIAEAIKKYMERDGKINQTISLRKRKIKN